MKLGAPLVKEPEIRRVRALQMLQRRIAGGTMEQIGQEFGVSPETVSRQLKWAAREGLIEDHEERILNELVPEALRIYSEKMKKENDAFMAKDVLMILTKLGDRVAARREHVEEMTLSAYMRLRKEIQSEPANPTLPDAESRASLDSDVVDAQVLPPATGERDGESDVSD